MCAIVDANVAAEVFGKNKPPAGKEFYDWLNTGGGQLVAGGKLLQELNKTSARDWVRQSLLSGRARREDDALITEKAGELADKGLCKSDDTHVIALAKVSGARLLYSNDANLQDDFGNKNLIDKPRGKIYSTRIDKEFTKVHLGLLKRRNLCRRR